MTETWYLFEVLPGNILHGIDKMEVFGNRCESEYDRSEWLGKKLCVRKEKSKKTGGELNSYFRFRLIEKAPQKNSNFAYIFQIEANKSKVEMQADSSLKLIEP